MIERTACNQCRSRDRKIATLSALLSGRIVMNSRTREKLEALNKRIEWLENHHHGDIRPQSGAAKELSGLRFAVQVIIAFAEKTPRELTARLEGEEIEA